MDIPIRDLSKENVCGESMDETENTLQKCTRQTRRQAFVSEPQMLPCEGLTLTHHCMAKGESSNGQ